MYYSKIMGTGTGLPERSMTNTDLEKFLDTSDEWIRTRTGIQARRIADPAKGETSLSLAEKASRSALEMAGLSGSDLDLIVVGTITPDTVMPTTGNYLQARLGMKQGFSFDLQAACSGSLYALSIADLYIRSGLVKNALIVGVETLSTLMNWQDRGTCVLFGDGAGAMVLSRTTDPTSSVLTTKLYSDGSYHDILKVPHGYCKVPPYSAEYRNSQHKIQMQGQEVFKLAVRNMLDSSNEVLKENNKTPEQVDFFIFHQANIRIIDMCLKALNVPKEKTWINIEKYGNTSAATLPIALDEAWRSKTVKRGDLILMATFGGGVTWGSTLIRL